MNRFEKIHTMISAALISIAGLLVTVPGLAEAADAVLKGMG